MSRKIYKPFRFKRFAVHHSRSAHKVGVDGVLSGLLCPLPTGGGRILDVGCGCGVISLILAQRTEDSRAEIYAIDIDPEAIDECRSNFENSPWADRLHVDLRDFSSGFCGDVLHTDEFAQEYDLIVSNPPYFEAGVDSPESRREIARHCGELSPSVLVKLSGKILKAGGSLTVIVPCDQADKLELTGNMADMELVHKIWIKGHVSAPVKRVVLTFHKGPYSGELRENILILEKKPGVPTEEYRTLGHAFYLYF